MGHSESCWQAQVLSGWQLLDPGQVPQSTENGRLHPSVPEYVPQVLPANEQIAVAPDGQPQAPPFGPFTQAWPGGQVSPAPP